MTTEQGAIVNLLQEKYPPVSDPQEDDPEGHEAWMQIQELKRQGYLVPYVPDIKVVCKHQFIPWLKLLNGSSYTECIECGVSYQYDY